MTRCIKCNQVITPRLDVTICTNCEVDTLLSFAEEIARLQAIETRLLAEWNAANDAAYRDAQLRDVCERALGYVPAGRKDIFGDLGVSE